jgi:hypothetical protein
MRPIGWLLAAYLCWASALQPAYARGAFGARGHPDEEPARALPRPRLVVLVVVDQLGSEWLERLEPALEGGLARFVRHGRWYTQAAHEHALSVTAPGHASLATGSHPARHGIVANEWFERESGRMRAAVEDAHARPLLPAHAASGAASQARSAASGAALRVDGLADWIAAADARARTLAIAGKDRGAVLLAGRGPQLALWWDREHGGFVSSTAYASALPDWVQAWNRAWLARASATPEVWQPLQRAALAALELAPDEQEGESFGLDGRRSFPHAAPPVSAPPRAGELARLADFSFRSPLVDAHVLELASRALSELELGQDEATDLLALSLSARDSVGHLFGPASREATDVALRVDAGLGAFFAQLDARIGAEHWIAMLSADHGVLELPERLRARGDTGVRVPAAELHALRARLEEASAEGAPIARFDGGQLDLAPSALAPAALAAQRARLAAVLREHASYALHVHTRDELLRELERARGAPATDRAPADAALRLALASFDAQRSPDVSVQLRPGHLLPLAQGTTHGSPHEYDRRVPLVFLGPGFEAARSAAPVATVDAAPTLLERLGLPVPAALDGRALR